MKLRHKFNIKDLFRCTVCLDRLFPWDKSVRLPEYKNKKQLFTPRAHYPDCVDIMSSEEMDEVIQIQRETMKIITEQSKQRTKEVEANHE